MDTNAVRNSKTRAVYTDYGKSRRKKEFRAAHESELALHEVAKKAFDTLGGAKIPKVAQLQEKYATLLAEKKAGYEEYKMPKKEMLEYMTVKQNIDRILSISPLDPERRNQPER